MAAINICYLLASFLIGAIPFSVIIGKVFYGIDVRQKGSGNPGATNTLRVLGTKAGFVVLILDILKGVVPVLLAPAIMQISSFTPGELKSIAGACAILGHIFSPFLRFKGGKGVATSTGVIFALNWPLALAAAIVFIIVVAVTRYISLGSILSAVSFAALECIYNPHSIVLIVFSIALALVIIVKHRSNIGRLINGNENRFTLKRS